MSRSGRAQAAPVEAIDAAGSVARARCHADVVRRREHDAIRLLPGRDAARFMLRRMKRAVAARPPSRPAAGPARVALFEPRLDFRIGSDVLKFPDCSRPAPRAGRISFSPESREECA